MGLENRYKLTYDLKTKVVSNIKFKQGNIDSSVIEVQIVDNGLAVDITGETIEFRFQKPDKTTVFQDSLTGVTILDAPKGKVECVLKSNTLAVAGNAICEIHRSKDGKELTCPSFSFLVESSIGNDGVLSSNYISSIENKIIEWQTEFDVMKQEYTTYKNVMTAESNVANLQSQINDHSSSLAEIMNSGGGNNAETIIRPTSTRAEIQTLLDNGGKFRFTAGTYNFTDFQTVNDGVNGNIPVCLNIQSNTIIEMDKGVIFNMPTNNYDRHYLISIINKSNVSIINGTLHGDRATHTGTPQEDTGAWGHGISVIKSENIYIRNVKSENMWGDGFYINGLTNGAIEYCISDNNRRQGISIIEATNLRIKGSVLSNTDGSDPRAGIDIEPNYSTQKIKGITIEDCYCFGNTGSGIEINIMKLESGTATTVDNVDITIQNCNVEGGLRGIAYSNSLSTHVNNVKGTIAVENCKIKNTEAGLYVDSIRDANVPKMKVRNLLIDGFTECGIKHRGTVSATTYGSLYLDDVEIYDTGGQPYLTFSTGTGTASVMTRINNLYKSGTADYSITGTGSGHVINSTKVVALTQAAYDALPSSKTTDNIIYEIIG